VRTKLDKAKAAYTADVENYRATVAAWFDKREEAARKNGDKKAVDQIKAERQAFDGKGELPKHFPPAMRSQLTAARTKLEAAYKAAISEYIKGKRDEDATAVEKELAGLQPGSPSKAVSVEERIADRVWYTGKGQFEFKRGGALVRDGKKVGTWAVIGSDRVVSVLDDGHHYDLWVFNTDFTIFQAHYIGQPSKDAGIVGKAARVK
jgi:hypothetical protein